MKEQRLEWVDLLKFLGIWAIYIGHFGPAAGGKLYAFVFVYHVPLFFFAAGIFSNASIKLGAYEFIKKKTRQLLLPYIFFTLLALFIFALHLRWDLNEGGKAFLSSLFGVRNSLVANSLWFFPCLYVMTLLDYGLLRLTTSRMATVLIAGALFVITQVLSPKNPLIAPSWIFNIDSALFYYIFYAVGGLSLSWARKPVPSIFREVVLNILNLGAFFFAAILYLNGSEWVLFGAAGLLPLLYSVPLIAALFTIVSAFVLIYVNICVAKALSHIAFLQNIGRETLILCGTEDVFKLLVLQLFLSVGLKIEFSSPLAVLLIALLLLVACKLSFASVLNTYFPGYIGKAASLRS